MNKWRVYTLLQFKRSFKQFPKVAAFTVVLLLAAIVICSLLLQQNTNSEENKLINVGITGHIDNTYLKLGILAIKEFDSSNSYVEFVSVDSEERAMELLKRGDLSGYLYVPDDFVDAVMYGGEINLTYVSINSPVGFGPMLTNEVINSVSDLVGETVAGIIAVQRMAKRNGLTTDMDQLVEDINIHYITYVLERDELYEVNYIGLHNGLSFLGYYICGILFFIILLMGIVCAPMMTRKNSALVALAKTRGIEIYQQVFAEFLGFFISPAIVIFLIGAVLSALSRFTDIPVLELQNISFAFAFSLLPVVLMVCAMQMLIYECCVSINASILLQFVIAVGLAYISGCFYPPYFFPESIQNAAAVLPGGIAMNYMGNIFNGTMQGLIAVLCYALIFFLLTGCVRLLRVRREYQ